MMDADNLGISIAKSLVDERSENRKKVEAVWRKVAREICNHIKQHAEIAPGIKVDTPAGPGVTTGQGKIT